jgi:aspartate kinase
VDLSGWGDGRELTIDQRIQDTFKTLDPKKSICLATGYTKGIEGIMREFDRGYSEVTFAKVAVIIKADEAVIHKEYRSVSPTSTWRINSRMLGWRPFTPRRPSPSRSTVFPFE